MADVYSSETRSKVMSKVHGKNTRQEMFIRSLLHSLGFRFRLYRRDLPGNPDIVLPKWKAVVFVNGCFWHQHDGCRRASRPKSNVGYWDAKLSRNIERDKRNQQWLHELGWRTIIVWECDTKNHQHIERFLREAITNPTALHLESEHF
jgi:DNA mismatch endonuclease, patch repair protein